MDSVLEPLIKSFLAQMDSAMKVSELISQHDGSEEITVDHLITGLVYRLMVPMTNEEVDTALETAQEIMDKLDETDSEEESMASEAEEGEAAGAEEAGEEAGEEAEEAIVDFGSRKVKAPRCNCEVCMKARLSLLNYQAYDCTDPLAEKFKKAIDSTCSKHKIFI